MDVVGGQFLEGRRRCTHRTCKMTIMVVTHDPDKMVVTQNARTFLHQLLFTCFEVYWRLELRNGVRWVGGHGRHGRHGRHPYLVSGGVETTKLTGA